MAFQELGERPPSHLWISIPWGPKWITGHTYNYWKRWIRNVTKLVYYQIELGGNVHLEGPTDSAVWDFDDRDFQYLIRNVFHRIHTDCQYFGSQQDDGQPSIKRETTVYTTDLNLKRNFRTPKAKRTEDPSLVEDKNEWRFWNPTYPSGFCDEIMATITSYRHLEQQRAKEFLESWPNSQND